MKISSNSKAFLLASALLFLTSFKSVLAGTGGIRNGGADVLETTQELKEEAELPLLDLGEGFELKMVEPSVEENGSAMDNDHQRELSSDWGTPFYIANSYSGNVLAIWGSPSDCENGNLHYDVEQRRFDPNDKFSQWQMKGNYIRNVQCTKYYLSVSYANQAKNTWCQNGRKVEVWKNADARNTNNEYNSAKWVWESVWSSAPQTKQRLKSIGDGCNKYLDLSNHDVNVGRSVTIYDRNNDNGNNWNQHFAQLNHNDEMIDFFHIYNPWSGLAIDVPGGNCGQNGIVGIEPQTWDLDWDNRNQKWWYDSANQLIRSYRCPGNAMELPNLSCETRNTLKLWHARPDQNTQKMELKDGMIKSLGCSGKAFHIFNANDEKGANMGLFGNRYQGNTHFIPFRKSDIFSIANSFYEDGSAKRSLDINNGCSVGKKLHTWVSSTSNLNQQFFFNPVTNEIEVFACPGKVLGIQDNLYLTVQEATYAGTTPAPTLNTWSYTGGYLVPGNDEGKAIGIQNGNTGHSANFVYGARLGFAVEGHWYQKFQLVGYQTGDSNIVNTGLGGNYNGPGYSDDVEVNHEWTARSSYDHIYLCSHGGCGGSGWSRDAISVSKIGYYHSESLFNVRIDGREFFMNLENSRDNQISQVTVPSGYCVKLFSERDLQGGMIQFGASSSSAAVQGYLYRGDLQFNDVASSVLITEWDSNCVTTTTANTIIVKRDSDYQAPVTSSIFVTPEEPVSFPPTIATLDVATVTAKISNGNYQQSVEVDYCPSAIANVVYWDTYARAKTTKELCHATCEEGVFGKRCQFMHYSNDGWCTFFLVDNGDSRFSEQTCPSENDLGTGVYMIRKLQYVINIGRMMPMGDLGFDIINNIKTSDPPTISMIGYENESVDFGGPRGHCMSKTLNNLRQSQPVDHCDGSGSCSGSVLLNNYNCGTVTVSSIGKRFFVDSLEELGDSTITTQAQMWDRLRDDVIVPTIESIHDSTKANEAKVPSRVNTYGDDCTSSPGAQQVQVGPDSCKTRGYGAWEGNNNGSYQLPRNMEFTLIMWTADRAENAKAIATFGYDLAEYTNAFPVQEVIEDELFFCSAISQQLFNLFGFMPIVGDAISVIGVIAGFACAINESMVEEQEYYEVCRRR